MAGNARKAGEPRVADTSCLYAVFDAEDEHHAEALGELEDGSPLVVPSEVLVETLGLIKARAGKAAAATARDFLMALPHAEFTHPTELHEALQIQGEHPGLGIVDACVLWHCRRLRVRAASFDRKLRAKAARFPS